MFKYRVFDKNVNKFINIELKDRVENLTEVRGHEFWAKFTNIDEPHLFRIIEGPIKVVGR